MKDQGRPIEVDRAVAAIRADEPGAGIVEAAAERVGAALSLAATGDVDVSSIQGCVDYQALLPAFVARALPEARMLLVGDHTRQCVPCRRALLVAREGAKTVVSAAPRTHRAWLAAAAAALVVGLGLGGFWLAREVTATGGEVARVESVDGDLFAVSDGAVLVPGRVLSAHEAVRSGRGASAFLRLSDGTRIEVAERTELALVKRREGTTVELARGRVLVEAAKQRDGHLFLSTDDCQVAVTGTVFAVTHGTKVFRVSVVEGRVEVSDSKGEHVLRAGDQVTTHQSVAAVTVGRDIAWSRGLERHLVLLGELRGVERAIAEGVAVPTPRMASRLLDVVPADTIAYVAVPNLGPSLQAAWQIFQSKLAETPALRDLLEGEAGATTADQQVGPFIARLGEIGGFLGEEVVLAAVPGTGDRSHSILALAEVTRPGLDAFLGSISRDRAEDQRPVVVVVADPRATDATASADGALLVWIGNGLVAASGSMAPLRDLADAMDRGTAGLAHGPFRARLVEAYGEGVSWLFALDVASLRARYQDAVAGSHEDRQRVALENAGLLDVEHLVLEQRDAGDVSHRSMTATFSRSRRGIAAWLAAPAPMAALDYLSPDPVAAAAFVVREPSAMLADLLATAESLEPGAIESFRKVERAVGVRFAEDLARALGGEVAFALDGPVVPMPSWKIVLEVYDPGAVVAAVGRLIEQANVELRGHGEAEFALTSESAAGRDFYAIRRPNLGLEVHFVFSDGYAVLGPSRAVLERALQYRDSGANLARSEKFTALFPQDAYANFSAILYQNVAGMLGPVAEHVAAQSEGVSDGQRRALGELARNAEPSLFVGYAEEDRIRFAGSGRTGLFGFDIRTILSLHGLSELSEVLERATAAGETTTESHDIQ